MMLSEKLVLGTMLLEHKSWRLSCLYLSAYKAIYVFNYKQTFSQNWSEKVQIKLLFPIHLQRQGEQKFEKSPNYWKK